MITRSMTIRVKQGISIHTDFSMGLGRDMLKNVAP